MHQLSPNQPGQPGRGTRACSWLFRDPAAGGGRLFRLAATTVTIARRIIPAGNDGGAAIMLSQARCWLAVGGDQGGAGGRVWLGHVGGPRARTGRPHRVAPVCELPA
jgi:hypothetical protein